MIAICGWRMPRRPDYQCDVARNAAIAECRHDHSGRRQKVADAGAEEARAAYFQRFQMTPITTPTSPRCAIIRLDDDAVDAQRSPQEVVNKVMK